MNTYYILYYHDSVLKMHRTQAANEETALEQFDKWVKRNNYRLEALGIALGQMVDSSTFKRVTEVREYKASTMPVMRTNTPQLTGARL